MLPPMFLNSPPSIVLWEHPENIIAVEAGAVDSVLLLRLLDSSK